MKIEKELIKKLAKATNITNTVNGGTIFPTFEKSKEEDHYRLEVRVPGIPQEKIKIVMSGVTLVVSHEMTSGEDIFPNFLGFVPISADVDVENISAGFDDDILVIILPFNELTGGYQKEIDILKN